MRARPVHGLVTPYTGIRNEGRTAHLEDLDTKSWKFRVRRPKGTMRYGKQRETMVLPPAARLFFASEKRGNDTLQKRD